MAHLMSDAQATDEAVLLTIRRWRRLHPEAFADVMSSLGEGARWALQMADNRADALRASVGGAGQLEWPTLDDEVEDET